MKTNVIGVLYEDKAGNGLTQDFFAAILDSFKCEIQAKGYHMCFINTNRNYPDRKTFYEQALERKYDGIIIVCTDFHNPEVVELMQSGIPTVIIDKQQEGVISVQSDNDGGMAELMNYLVNMNHKRIAYITGEDCLVTRARIKAYMDCLKEAGIRVHTDFIKQGKFRDINRASYLTEELMRLSEIPSCIIYPDDYAAIGGINVLRARGLQIPGDVSVAGYDGINIMSIYEPRITTVVQDKKEMGRAAAQKLMEWMETGTIPQEQTVLVKAHLQKGRSVKRAYY